MPGTIQVSVLDLLGLPSSSISVKVSMGSREHQVRDRAEFSFPLTTLQEDLIVTLYDIAGNELSRTGVNTKLVVEKGIWNAVFPLEGGGHLPMKLQFILSKEERQRIQRMRESARKKKQDELLLNSRIHPEIAAVASAAFNHEVTDSRESIAQMDAGTVARSAFPGYPMANPVSHSKNLESAPEYRKNKTDGETEFSQERKVFRLTAKPSEAAQQILTESDTHLPPNDVTSRPISRIGALGYAQPASNNIIAASEAISSVPIPSQEHKNLHLTESIQKIPVKIDTQSPLKEIITRSKSSPTLSTIKQTALRRTLRNNGTEGEGTLSEATRQFLMRKAVQSPSNIISKQPTIKQIVLQKALKNNETDREGTSYEVTHALPVKFDPQSPLTNVSTKSNSLHNQTHSTTEQIAVGKTLTDKTDTDGTSSTNNMPEKIKIFRPTGTPWQVKEMNDNQLPSKVGYSNLVAPKEAKGSSALFLRKKGDSALSPLEGRIHANENHASVDKTPSNVRKLITALESSIYQVPLPRANAFKLKPHLITESPLEGTSIKDANMKMKAKDQIAETEAKVDNVRKPLEMHVQQEAPYLNKVHAEVSMKVPNIKEVNVESIEERQQNLVSTSRLSEHVGAQAGGVSDGLPTLQRNRPLKVLDVRAAADEGHTLSERVHDNIKHKKENMDRQKILLEEVDETSKVETATTSERVRDDPVSKEQTHKKETVEAADRLLTFDSRKQLVLLAARPAAVAGNSASMKIDSFVQHVKENIAGQETWLEESVVASEAETATVSGRTLDDPVTREHSHSVHLEQEAFAPNMLEKRKWRNYGDESEVCETSLEKQKLLKYLRAEQSDNQIMGSWILPHEERPLCITTGSKQMVDLVACSDTCGRSDQTETILPRGVESEVAMGGDMSTGANETEMASHKMRKPKLEKSNDCRDFGGLIGQALKIGIVVAFGTLVVFARQK